MRRAEPSHGTREEPIELLSDSETNPPRVVPLPRRNVRRKRGYLQEQVNLASIIELSDSKGEISTENSIPSKKAKLDLTLKVERAESERDEWKVCIHFDSFMT